MLKFNGYDIMFQEVPNETSLVFFISGCPYRCEGCHSKHLWEDNGEDLYSVFQIILERYSSFITCVCFMGGDHIIEELESYLKIIKDKGLKTCLYTGNDNFSTEHEETLNLLDFLKEGSYKKELGGLDNPNTNQKFYKIKNGIKVEELFFYKKGE